MRYLVQLVLRSAQHRQKRCYNHKNCLTLPNLQHQYSEAFCDKNRVLKALGKKYFVLQYVAIFGPATGFQTTSQLVYLIKNQCTTTHDKHRRTDYVYTS